MQQKEEQKARNKPIPKHSAFANTAEIAHDHPFSSQIFFLHQTVGNQAVQRLFTSGAIQAKLTIGRPNDIYEQEADRVAEAVMRMPEPQVQRKCAKCEEEERLQAKPIGNRITPLLQRQVEPEEEEEPIQAKGEGNTPVITSNLASSINALHGGGRPLSKAARAFFEPRFGRDFSGVRVHTSSRANQLARSINARAFTRGNDIVFGGGEYSPESAAGKRLLGHELTHVVQQDAARGEAGPDVVGAELLQRVPMPLPDFERFSRPSGAAPPSPPVPQPAPPLHFTIPSPIEQAVNNAFAAVGSHPRNYEYDFIQILLAPEYDRVRVTLNFFIRRFPNVYRLLDTDLRSAVQSQFQDPMDQEEMYYQSLSNIANLVFLAYARQWDRQSPRFHRRLEQERRRREQQRHRPLRPGETYA